MAEKRVSSGRIYTYDLLRGLCAIFVAVYHLMYWTGGPVFPVAGSFGVYMFFALSGATMYYVYKDKLFLDKGMVKYFAVRYARIWPLYAFVVLIYFTFLIFSDSSRLDQDLLSRFLLNISLLFGFSVPGKTSMVTGGWSIGIEFVFYCVFPIMVMLFSGKSMRTHIFVVVVCILVQLIFVNYAIAAAGHDVIAAWPTYTNFLSFIGFFAFGMFVAKYLLVKGGVRAHFSLLIVFTATVLFMFNTTFVISEVLSGWTGILNLGLALGLFLAWSYWEIPVGVRPVAKFIGDVSYSVYLLHPIAYKFIVMSVGVLPVSIQQYGSPVVIIALSLVATVVGAYLTFHFVEKSLLGYAKARINAMA